MSLSCSCNDDYGWYFEPPDNYTTFPLLGRRKRCSCGELIEHGVICLEFRSYRMPNDDVEIRIYGEDGEVLMASKWLCERCADLYFSFVELGFECVSPEDKMLELAEDYADMYGAQNAQTA